MIVVGALVLLAVIAVAVVFDRKARKRRRPVGDATATAITAARDEAAASIAHAHTWAQVQSGPDSRIGLGGL